VGLRDVVLYMSMSLDGFVDSDREHPGMAIPEGAELKPWKLDRISKAGAHLMGRVTYQQMSSYWPHSDDPYAGPMNDIPKVVFSQTLGEAEATWPVTRVARGELATEIAAIKAESGPDVIAWGGAGFAGALAAADLVDEYRLLVQPLVLGRWRPHRRRGRRPDRRPGTAAGAHRRGRGQSRARRLRLGASILRHRPGGASRGAGQPLTDRPGRPRDSSRLRHHELVTERIAYQPIDTRPQESGNHGRH
jgi:dihydrofolate reductase